MPLFLFTALQPQYATHNVVIHFRCHAEYKQTLAGLPNGANQGCFLVTKITM